MSLFVPEDQVNAEFFGASVYDRALFQMKEMPEVGHGAHALGVASGALEAFVDAVNMKPLPGSTRHTAMGHMQAHQYLRNSTIAADPRRTLSVLRARPQLSSPRHFSPNGQFARDPLKP